MADRFKEQFTDKHEYDINYFFHIMNKIQQIPLPEDYIDMNELLAGWISMSISGKV
jgi:hypothetical protein